MPTPKILWIHGTTDLQAQPELYLALSGFDVSSVAALADAQSVLARQDMDCVLVEGPAADGGRMAMLESLRGIDGFVPVVFYDPDLTAAEAVRLHRAGAHYCLGYRDSLEALRECLEQAAEERRCQSRRRFSAPREAWRELLVGESAAMRRVVDTIRLVGARRCTVLISGESGTGKELVARAIHLASPRAQHNMVAINCTALPEHLLEAEMFGHTKGAFTGAVTTRVGRFEQAHRGTLFLDEIADMPLEMQSKLLRVLQDREFQRLGSSDIIKVDVRVIAASNVNLLERVRQGRFREDLYYRLNVVPLQLPALRERDGDIPLEGLFLAGERAAVGECRRNGHRTLRRSRHSLSARSGHGRTCDAESGPHRFPSSLGAIEPRGGFRYRRHSIPAFHVAAGSLANRRK
jgi:DNA-binding NtrC family response regulator